uniref:Dolichyl-diphosphooligosaccharide--protein glycosyltransferase subunit 2 n=1 Tax=Globodera rostochiensis TaxID=31243 RepID=A0A914HVF7_GLORO
MFSKIFAVYLYESVRISEAQLSVKESVKQQKNRPLGTLNLPLDHKISKLVRLSKNFIVQLTFRIVDDANNQPIEHFQQTFVRFTHTKSPDHEVFIVAKEHKKLNGYYQLEMKMSRDFVRFNSRPGKYNCELILGDSRVRSGLRLEIFDAFLDISKQFQPEEPSYKPRKRDTPNFERMPEIQHKFKKIEGCKTKYWTTLSYAFCFVCFLPLILLSFNWRVLTLKALQNLFSASDNANFSAPIFFNMLIALFSLYIICWVLGTSIAIELQLTVICAIPCFFACHKMLNALATDRIEIENEALRLEWSQNDHNDDLENDYYYSEEMNTRTNRCKIVPLWKCFDVMLKLHEYLDKLWHKTLSKLYYLNMTTSNQKKIDQLQFDSTTLTFFVNGIRIDVKSIDPRITLAAFLRDKLNLRGTKIGCNEGGCGACTVMVSELNPNSGEIRHYSVNACLSPVCSVFGKAVTTVEGIGGGQKRIHPVQERLSRAHGSQCGYCTPGFVMAMYTLLRNKPEPTYAEVDECLQGNLCRCTGYRPILEAFYSFTKTNGQKTNCCREEKCCMSSNGLVETENRCDSNGRKTHNKLSNLCTLPNIESSQELIFPPELTFGAWNQKSFMMENDGYYWYQPVKMEQLLALKREFPNAHTLIFDGSSTLKIFHLFEHFEVKKMDFVQFVDKLPNQKTKIFAEICNILSLFAGNHVRNMATVAGNMATASPISDLNPIWMASGAKILLKSEEANRIVCLDQNFFPTYRKTLIAPDEAQRREDDIAIVTGVFSVKFYQNKGPRVESMQMAFGGMGATTRMASKPTQNLKGRIWDEALFNDLSGALADEFRLPENVPGGMAKYRQALVLSFSLKFYLYVREQLGLTCEKREMLHLSEIENKFESTQIYQDVLPSQNKTDPVGRPLMHSSGEKHTTGEAIYTTDVQLPSDCLYMAYVTSPVSCGKIIGNPDYSSALCLDGVIGHVDWRDVPGSLMISHSNDVPLFATDQTSISYHGQPIAAIIANDNETARRAASLVHVEILKPDYEEKTIITIEEAIRHQSYLFPEPFRIHSSLNEPNATIKSEIDWKKFSRTIKGQIRIGEGDEMHIISSTQSVNDVQGDVATVLGVARNVVTVTVRRIGGGFGGKESCTGLFAGAAAIAAKKFKKPIRFWLERFDDMAISGNRHPFRFDYQFALENDCDKIAAMEVNAYSNCGYSFDLSKGVMERALAHIDNVYKFGNVNVYGHLCKTNLASNTAFRGFGGPQGMFATETIIKHAAEQFGIDVDTLRELNMYTTEGDITHYGMHLRQCNIRRCWTECQKLSNYDQQKLKLQEWNSKNKYLKRGIYMVPTKFGIAFGFKRLNQAGALVHVYTDGSVLISHGGMEMGQGLHTKIQQIASRCLGIDVSMIQIIDTATDKVPNASPTAASVGSDVNGLAVKNACEIILKRLEPLRKELPNESTWKDLVMHAYINRVQLSVTGFATIHCEPVDFTEGRGAEYYSYCVYGVGCAEVEVDCLTGDHRVIRVDIVMDVGESLNPAVDIGQIEGAFVQGFGLFTMEELKIRPDGVRLTRGPGTYKIPSADDAPRQFNVKLLDGSSNKNGIFSSKAIGEPPLFLGSAPFFAIREAIRNYRIQNGNLGYFRLDSPATPERIRLACEDSLLEKAIPQPSKGQRWTTEL